MCYSPTLIKNPNRGRKDKLAYVVDTVSQYIPVPCGHCGECIRLRSNGILQRAQLEELFGYPYMVSLSVQPKSMMYYECSNGFQIPYLPISDLQNMFKRLRKSGSLTRPFRYFATTELGGVHGRPHAHILLFLERRPEDTVYTPLNLEKIAWSAVLQEWRRNIGSTRNPEYIPICTYISRIRNGRLNETYNLHYVTPSLMDGTTEDVSFYVTKYLVKDSEWKDKLKRRIFYHSPTLEEAETVWSAVRPRAISSLNFGFGYYGDINPRKTSKQERLAILNGLESARIVRDCIERSSKSEKTARFYDLQTGKSMPLARYWYKFGDIYDLDHHNIFLSRQDRLEGGVSVDERDLTSKLLSEQKHLDNSKDSKQTFNDLIYAES